MKEILYLFILALIQVVIFCQPNASDLGEYLQPCCANIPLMAELFDTDVYAFDYSGYGYSSGKPSEANIYADIRAVYEFVRKTRPDKKIVLLGFSLGTATVSDMAASRPEGLAGVVLVAPFTSGLRLIGDQPEKPTTCTLDRFNTYEKVGKIVVPLLVCHGNQDETIEVEHGLELARLARRAVPPLIIDEANHITIFNGKYMQTFTRIRRFLDEEINQSQECETNANIHDSAQEKMIM
uniref:AB hydrolase-1 domain-containing protein n=1 Tax=Angiostrongylus cantonensis TaxID=6313 RepID=A0A158P9Z3_ANGCA